MSARKGFTLLELLMVVIIIGILAAVAIPQYLKTREKARMAEALSILGQIRASEARYYAEKNTYTTTMTDLDFDPVAGVIGTPFYTYSVTGDSTDFAAVATRGSGVPAGCLEGYTVRIDRDGNTCGTDCQSTATTC